MQTGELPTIKAAPLQMLLLFGSLIDNALKFRSNDRAPVIRITALREGGGPDAAYRIRVEDNGIGFDEKYLSKIFEPFKRLHGNTVYAGTGIGLAICRRIARRHGGWIRAESMPGEGSTFTVWLPARPGSSEA